MKGWIVAAGLVLAVSGCTSSQGGPIVHYAPEKITAQIEWLELWADPILIHDMAPYPIPTRGFNEYGKFIMKPKWGFHGKHWT